MKKLLIKILLFSLPILFFLLIPFLLLRICGENYNQIDNITQSNENYLIGFSYDETNYQYLKYMEIKNQNKKKIIALGSSRVLPFRDSMFTSSFYNAGYTISGISDFLPFIQFNFKNKKPEILLLALDQWMFNERWDSLLLNKQKSVREYKKSSIKSHFYLWRDIINGKIDVFKILLQKKEKIKKIGLNALVNYKGFLKDGSMFYGEEINKKLKNDNNANDYNFIDTFTRIETGNNRFEFGNNLNKKAINELHKLLIYCKKNNIKVIAFLPPFANKVNLKIKSTNKHNYMSLIYKNIMKYFLYNNFELWDLHDLKLFNSTDEETLDGFHGGEVCYLKMLIYMLENKSVLNNYANLSKLKQDLIRKENKLMVYKPSFTFEYIKK